MSTVDLPSGVTYITNIKGNTGSLAFATAETISWTEHPAVSMIGDESNRGAHFEIPLPMPGPELLQVREDAVQARNEAEVFAAGTAQLQDEAVDAILGNQASSTRGRLNDLVGALVPPSSTGGAVGYTNKSFPLPSSDKPHNAFPALVRMTDGRYLAVWRGASAHNVLDGELFYSIGVSPSEWEPAQSVPIVGVAGLGDIRDAGLSLDGDGNILLTFYDGGSKQSYWQSSTDGEIWSSAKLLPFSWSDYAFTSAPIVVLPSGVWIVGAYGRNSGDGLQQIRVIRSTDGGATWDPPVTVAGPGHLSEINIMATGAHSAIALIRTTPEDRYILQTSTSDAGLTWTAPVKAFSGEGNPHMLRLGNGSILVAYRALEKATSTGRQYVGVRASRNNGASWSDERLVARAPYWSVYAAMAEIDDNSALMVWAGEASSALSRVYATVLSDGAAITKGGDASSHESVSPTIATQQIRAYLTATQPVPISTWTEVQWGGLSANAWYGVNLDDSPGQFWVNETGLYFVEFQPRFNVPCNVEVGIFRNGTDQVKWTKAVGIDAAQLSGVMLLSPDFTYSARVYVTSASGVELQPGSQFSRTMLQVSKIKGL